MKKFSKQLISLLLAVVLLLGLLPVKTNAAAGNTVRIYVLDDDGNAISNATVTVHYGRGSTQTNTALTVTNKGNGQYTFVDAGNYYYKITATCPGYDSYTYTTRRVDPTSSTTYTATLTKQQPQYADFKVFYFISANENKPFPDSYAGAGDAGNYGPSRNNTPLVTISVNITELKLKEKVVYTENTNGNQYDFSPVVTAGENLASRKAATEAFWKAVWECTTEESKQAFAATGLDGAFQGYCLKKQNDGSQHCDGYLTVTPPIYVIEMYCNNQYFAGEATDSNTAGMDVYDLLAFCEDYLKQTITWTEDAQGRPALVKNGENDTMGHYEGTYILGDEYHKVTITQRAMNTPTDHPSGLKYDKISDQYYLAMFDMEDTVTGYVQYVVTYTDGVTTEEVFNDHHYPANRGKTVPAYTGIYTRKDHTFLGWVLEGGDGTVLSDAQVRAMTVTGNMTFHAVWAAVPKYTGTVELVLNGTYDAATHIATGERVDATQIRGPSTKLYVKDETKLDAFENYVELTHTATGTYSAQLPNGNYYFFYSIDGGTTMVSTGNQLLTINNESRVRYLFYNTVQYDLNGGTGGPSKEPEYYRSGYPVNVSSLVPTREGYVFLGWTDEMDESSEGHKHYQPGEALTQDISRAHLLKAHWETVTRAKVNLKVIINHRDMDGDKEVGRDASQDGTMTVNLVYRSKDHANTNEPYVEVVQGDNRYSQTIDQEYTNNAENNYTTTVVFEPFFYDNLSTDYEYSANAFLEHYWNVDRKVTASTDASGNVTYDVEIHLQYNPDLFTLHYKVVLDESVPNNTVSATDVKVISWDAQVKGQWAPISRHQNYSVDVDTTNRAGEGSYNVPAHRSDREGTEHYYYRVRPVGFTLADGTELITDAVVQKQDATYYSLKDPTGKYADEAFYAVATVTDGATGISGTNFTGAYAKPVEGSNMQETHVQQGEIVITVYANLYDVTFVPNGGQLPAGKAERLEKQFYVPDLNAYTPTRGGGYVFEGWYLADDQGNMTQNTVKSFEGLTKDITLIAKWRDPITVKGQISVMGSYVLTDENGKQTTHIIHDVDRAKSVVVALQHLDQNGYAETYYTKTVPLTYGEDHIGRGTYVFEGLHDEPHDHRILVLAPNYSTLYQNEPDSLTLVNDYGKYHAHDEVDANSNPVRPWLVVTGADDPATAANEAKIAVINAHLPFTPGSFDLEYQVDASKIGEGYRPEGTEILVLYNDDPTIQRPDLWPAISQMVINGQLVGKKHTLDAGGMADGKFNVWYSFPDGTTLYDYAIRVHATKKHNGAYVSYDETTAPFHVEYQAPAHWVDPAVNPSQQSQMLIAKLIPNTYPIEYVLNGGELTQNCPTSHTWSFATDLRKAIPVRQGYAFDGWYLDEELTQPAPAVLEAGYAQKTTLYAKWSVALDTVTLHATIVHTFEEGDKETNQYTSTLDVQLLMAERGSTDFAPVEGAVKSYSSNYWHTQTSGENVDECYILPVYMNMSERYDYSLDVSMDGYEIVVGPTVTKTLNDDGSTNHHVEVTLQYMPDPLDPLDITFDVEVVQGLPDYLIPDSVQVRVTCWYDQNGKEDWYPINRLVEHAVSVDIDQTTLTGTGTAYVWMWRVRPEEGQTGVPFYYRIEPISVTTKSGFVVALSGSNREDFTGNGYSAKVYTDEDCAAPTENSLVGVYGTVSNVDGKYEQTGGIKAVINSAWEQSLVFHANNPDYVGNVTDENGAVKEDVFRTYHPNGSSAEGDYKLTADGEIAAFYDLPVLKDEAHNNYIFKGWYLDPEDDSLPIKFEEHADATAFAGVTDVYAHWIEVGTVAKNPADGKNYGDYNEYDLVGVQIRKSNKNIHGEETYNGTTGAGLRFVAVLSQNVYDQIEALSEKNPIVKGASGTMEYGFAVASKSATDKRAQYHGEDYMLQCNATNVNGVNTTSKDEQAKNAYGYAKNMVCSGPTIIDHYKDENYRLYTAVITYKGDEATASVLKNSDFVARAYLRYTDANDMYRTHYNNYEGTQVYGGVCISYNGALAFVDQQQQ